MATETHVLRSTKRDRLGTRYARRVREAGGLPGVVYGHGQAPVHVAIEAKDALLHINAGEKVFSLKMDSDADETVLLKDVQFDYLGTNIIHVDLARVDLNEMVEVQAHVRLVGESDAMKEAGAILLHPTNSIEIRCRVTDIPEHIELDISELEIGHSLHASDLKLPSGFELASDPDDVLANIVIKQEVEEPAEGAEVVGEGEGPEVITEKKDESDSEGEKKE